MGAIVDVLAATAVAMAVVVAFLAARYRAPDHSVYDSPKTAPVIADADVSPEHDDVVRTLGTARMLSSMPRGAEAVGVAQGA